MEEIIFKPQFERGLSAANKFLFFLFIGGLFIALRNPSENIMMIFIGTLGILIMIIVPSYTYTQIRFNKNTMIVERYLYSDKEIQYNDIVDFDGQTLKGKEGIIFNISPNMLNGDELRKIIKNLIEEEVIIKNKFDGSLKDFKAGIQADGDKAGLIGICVTLPILLLITILSDMEVDIYMLFWLISAVVAGISLWILRKKRKKIFHNISNGYH